MSEKSSLEATGQLTNFDNPKIQFTYSSALDVAQLGSIIRSYQLRGGSVTFSGSGTYSTTTGAATRGYAAARGVTYLDNGVAVRDANVNADFALAGDQLSLTRIAGRLLGGGVTGGAEIKNIFTGSASASPSPIEQASQARKTGTKPSPNKQLRPSTLPTITGPGPQQGTAHLRMTGISLAELARMFSTRAAPYDKLNPVGSVAGTVSLAWTPVHRRCQRRPGA